jgi:surface antigen
MKLIIFPMIGLLALTMTACSNMGLNKGKQGAIGGAAGGAAIGQAVGRDTEATLIGAAVGSLLGYIVGNEMDKYDKQRLNQTYENIPSGHTSAWQNPDTGNRYQVTPQQAYVSPSNTQQPCREAEIIAVIDGKRQKTYTTACRNSRGQWELRND